jgi:pilus assembly protein CpaB
MSVQVRRSLLAEAIAPKELRDDDPHMTRAMLPPVEPFASRGSVFSSYRPFVVASVFALVAIGVVALMLAGVENRVKKGWNLVPVVVAAADLPEGTTIGLESISQRAVPEQFVTSSVVRPDSTEYVVNQRLLVPVQAGDPLLWTQFEASRVGERLSRKIQKKARALAIRASSTMAVGGWVTPNDRIDIIASFSKPNSQERTAVTLLNDVPVISAGKITATSLASQRERDKEFQDVTVLVIPEEAEIITLAARMARLKFTLRGEDSERDDITDARYRTEISTLLSGEKVQVIQKKRWELLKSIRAAKKARDL